MSNSAESQVLTCPSCGGPLPDGGRRVECPFCGTVVERPEAGGAPTVVEVSLPDVRPAVRRATRAGCVVTVAVAAVVVAVVGIIVWVILSSEGVIGIGPRTVRDVIVPVPSDRTGPPDVIVLTYHINDEIDTLSYIDGVNHTLRWDSPPLSEDAYNAVVVVDATQVYVADRARLLALQRADGQLAWETALSDSVGTSCEECLRVLGDRVVVLSEDGTLQAFESATGRPVWSHRLNETPRRLMVLNGQPAVLDEISQERQEVALHVWDPAGGELVQRIAPQCSEEHHTEDLELYSPVVVDPAGDAVYFFYGFFISCVEKWDTRDWEMLWQTTTEDDLYRPEFGPFLAEGVIYAGDANRVVAVDIADGFYRRLVDEEDYYLNPLAVRGGVLLVAAERRRGSRRYELWGLDATTGERRWQIIFEDEDPIYEAGSWAGNAWAAQFTSHGLVLMHFLEEPPRVVVEKLDPQSGVSSGEVVSDLGEEYWYGVVWADDAVLLRSRKLHAIDLVSGEVLWGWP